MIKFTLLISLYFLSSQHTSSTPEFCLNFYYNWPSLSCFQSNSWPELIHLLNKTNFTTSDLPTLDLDFFPHESLILTSQVLGEMRRKFHNERHIFISFHRLKGISVLDNFSNQTYSDATISRFDIKLDQSEFDFFIVKNARQVTKRTRMQQANDSTNGNHLFQSYIIR